MEFIHWTFDDLNVPMMEIKGKLYTTTAALAGALHVTPQRLRMVVHRRPNDFENSVNSVDAIDFLQTHRKQLGLKYVRGDMRLWSEHDMLIIGMDIQTPVARRFREAVIVLIQDHARRNYVPKEQFITLHREHVELQRRYDDLQNKYENINARVSRLEKEQPYAKDMASTFGRMLNAQKHTKAIRGLN